MGNGTTNEGYYNAGYGFYIDGGNLPAATWTDIQIDMVDDTATMLVNGTQVGTSAVSGGARQLYPGEPLTVGRYENGSGCSTLWARSPTSASSTRVAPGCGPAAPAHSRASSTWRTTPRSFGATTRAWQ